MDAVLRALAIYGFLLVMFRITGRRALSELTTFDFVLLLIISEATQQALLGDDFSVTNAFIVIGSLFFLDIAFSLLKERSSRIAKIFDGVPLVLVENGKPLKERMRKARIGEDDILESARKSEGLERLDQIRYAVLEKTGEISIIPRRGEN